MLHKRRGAHKSGVSDYFGVLGIERLLPDEQAGGAPSSVGNNASDDDGPPSESINDEYERSDSALTAKAGNLSVAGTPRNANLSSRRATSLSAVREEDGDEELKLLEERFQREIVDVSLVSSPAALDPDWSVSDGNLIVQSSSPLANDRLYLAYRRRGRPNATFEDSDDCDENDTTDDEAKKTRPQHYFAPAVADITIHNVKVRRSTVPLLESKLRANEISRTEKAQQPNKTTISPTKSFSAQTVDTLAHGAKQLSILAKRSGLAATTKDMATGAMAGLAQTLKERSPLNENSVVSGVVETILKTAQSPTKDKGSATVESDNSVRFGQPRHLYDTGTGSFETDLDGAGNFTDVNGEVNTYQSGMIKTPEKARRQHFFPDVPSHSNLRTEEGVILKPMDEILSIILRGKEWVVPSICSTLHLPTPELLQQRKIEERRCSRQSVNLVDRTHAMPSPLNASASSRASFGIGSVGSPSSLGVEAMYMSPTSSRSVNSGGSNEGGESALFETDMSPDPSYLPSLVAATTALSPVREKEFVYIPVLSLRRQRVGEDERYHEDPAIVDLMISTLNPSGLPQLPIDEDDEEEFGRSSKALMHNVAHVDILKKTKWTTSLSQATNTPSSSSAWPVLLLRRNVPNGLCDLPFAAKVLDRFPRQDYRGLPFPEEELPMFCYPNGSKLVRDRLRNLAMPRSYGFVVKNERGDSIYGGITLFCFSLIIYGAHALRSSSVVLDIHGAADQRKAARLGLAIE
ncbi:hypothetical protein THAOC_32351 [Thalassiosira oceanica]|uniref:uDENN domain-containing protein n=1 Tax=Thalassiosira oceanica TaxID=159749 RepID=K0R674_THAOC|nr:hypothetical protein THAOC_32351 [Thalassiosira oceanica]|eukprot:EJK48823.1 hypothetical protein THAOC_32351 [Thalassiosira oceanica]